MAELKVGLERSLEKRQVLADKLDEFEHCLAMPRLRPFEFVTPVKAEFPASKPPFRNTGRIRRHREAEQHSAEVPEIAYGTAAARRLDIEAACAGVPNSLWTGSWWNAAVKDQLCRYLRHRVRSGWTSFLGHRAESADSHSRPSNSWAR